MTASTESTTQANPQIRDFINDIAPIFRGRNVFIADVGAHVGSTFAAFYQSQLKINRACLFEANPKNFAKLQQCVEDLDASERATCLQVALSDTAGTAYLHDMNDMSRLVGTESKATETGDKQVFEVQTQPLDDFRTLFPDGHISILKVDVEGHESAVFKGAAGLLSDHAVEVVYVEAGTDRDNAQQTHYRDIEDIMLEHGYRLFKIYEQTMEWIDDRPLLRRMNMAFISPVVANKYPYSFLKELAGLDKKLEAKNGDIATLREQLGAKSDELAKLEQARAATAAELEKSYQELATLARTVNELEKSQVDRPQTDEFKALASRLANAERRVRDLESSTSWKITAPLRKVARALKR